MKKILTTCAFAFCLAVGAAAQEYNLFPTADGWIWLNNQATIDRYVGTINDDDYRVNTAEGAKIIQMVYADRMPDYPATEVSPDFIGAGAEGVTGAEGSRTGAIMLQPSSARGTYNGGGIVFCLPSCSTFSINFSCNSKTTIGWLATKNPQADMGNFSFNNPLNSDRGWTQIESYHSLGIFAPSYPAGNNTLEGVETLTNKENNLTIRSDEPIYVWLRSTTKDTIYVHGLKVTTPRPETAGITHTPAVNDAAGTAVYSIDGRRVGNRSDLNSLPKGIYITERGDRIRKVLKR